MEIFKILKKRKKRAAVKEVRDLNSRELIT